MTTLLSTARAGGSNAEGKFQILGDCDNQWDFYLRCTQYDHLLRLKHLSQPSVQMSLQQSDTSHPCLDYKWLVVNSGEQNSYLYKLVKTFGKYSLMSLLVYFFSIETAIKGCGCEHSLLLSAVGFSARGQTWEQSLVPLLLPIEPCIRKCEGLKPTGELRKSWLMVLVWHTWCWMMVKNLWWKSQYYVRSTYKAPMININF